MDCFIVLTYSAITKMDMSCFCHDFPPSPFALVAGASSFLAARATWPPQPKASATG